MLGRGLAAIAAIVVVSGCATGSGGVPNERGGEAAASHASLGGGAAAMESPRFRATVRVSTARGGSR
jgi:hypothetical protein